MLQFKEITLLATEIYFTSLSRLSTETKGLAAHADMKGERGGRHQPPGWSRAWRWAVRVQGAGRCRTRFAGLVHALWPRNAPVKDDPAAA